jgi:hypothetical protein
MEEKIAKLSIQEEETEKSYKIINNLQIENETKLDALTKYEEENIKIQTLNQQLMEENAKLKEQIYLKEQTNL